MIYKYYSDLSDFSIKNFQEDTICFSHVDMFNDTSEFVVQYKDDELDKFHDQFLEQLQLEEQKFRVRVCCFSQSNDLDNMWGYYANSGRGFCLGYDEQDLKTSSILLKEIDYSDDTPDFSSLNNDPKELFMAQCTHKKSCWKEEKEIRAMITLDDNYMFKVDTRLGANVNVFKPLAAGLISCELPCFINKGNEKYPCTLCSPVNVSFNIQPKELITGIKCDLDYEKNLFDIAEKKGIAYRKYGDLK